MKWLRSLLITALVLASLLGLGLLGIVYAMGAPESRTLSIEKIHEEVGIPVRVASPVPVEFTDYFYCDGDVVADVRAVIRAKVSEVVEAVHVKVGQPVAKGDSLVEFRQTDIEAEIQAAESAYAEAQNNYKRYVGLADQGVVPDDQLEDRRTRLDSMAAQLATTRSRPASRCRRSTASWRPAEWSRASTKASATSSSRLSISPPSRSPRLWARRTLPTWRSAWRLSSSWKPRMTG
jgi:multidrug efflux pump subunit AcrA (membrane-fusion protein)